MTIEMTPELRAKLDARKTAWELEKKSKAKHRPMILVCSLCKRPPQWQQWVARPAQPGEIQATKLGPFARWTPGGKVEELLSFSSPIVKFQGGKAHDACVRHLSNQR